MSSTAVSTVSLTLQPGKNIREHKYINEGPQKNSFHISAQETKQPEEELSNGITLRTHQAINETIQQESTLHATEHEIGSDKVGVSDEKDLENDSKKDQVKEGQHEHEKVPEKIASSDGQQESKQDRLLLDGPGQRYRLEKGANIPEIQNDREILIKVSPLSPDTILYLSANPRWSPLA